MVRQVLLAMWMLAVGTSSASAQTHFHHVRLNSVDPAAAIRFYTTHLSGEKAAFNGADAVWTQGSWLLFNKVKRPPPAEPVSPLFHIGWGAEDMKAEFVRQIQLGTTFQTVLTDGVELTFWWYPTAHAKALYGGSWVGRTHYASSRGRVFDHIAISVENLDQTMARLRSEASPC